LLLLYALGLKFNLRLKSIGAGIGTVGRMFETVWKYLIESEHNVERYLLNDNKVDAVEAIPWVINSAILWTVLSFVLNKDPYFLSSIHAIFVSAAALINLMMGHNELEYITFYIMAGYFVSDYFLCTFAISASIGKSIH